MFRNKVIGSGVPKSDYDMEEDEESAEEEESGDGEDNSFPAKLLSIIQSMPIHGHHDEDEDEVIDCAKAYVKQQLLALACPTYLGFDEEFASLTGSCT